MKKRAKEALKIYYLAPLLLIVSIVPLIVHLKVVFLDEVTYKHWTGQKENADFFSYYKALLLVAFSSVLLIMIVYAKIKNEMTIKKLPVYYIPISIYAIAIVLSTLFSRYGVIAQRGFADRYEGMYVLLAYLVVLFAAINLAYSEKTIKTVIAFMFVSAFILGTIGIFQYFGHDIFQTEFGKLLLLPREYRDVNLSFTFGKNTIYSTLYNTNYVGSYMAMLMPLAFAAFLYFDNIKLKIAMGFFTCLMFANWIGCRSRAGYIGGALAMLVLTFIYRKKIIKNIKSVLPLFACFILIFIIMDASAGGELSGRILATIRDINGYEAEKNDGYTKSGMNKPVLEDIVFSDKSVSIIYGGNALNLKLAGNEVTFRDNDGKELSFRNDAEGNLLFNDERYADYLINIDRGENIININLDNMEFSFMVKPDGFYIIGEKGILLDEIDHPEHIGFEGRERFASGRGFIWSRSIALLKKNILLGGGPDTYTAQFPQHDYVGKLNAFQTVDKIVDKPHNLYLLIGINTGVISLMAFVFILAAYFISSGRMYFSKKELQNRSMIGAALFAAILGYAIAGLANDSSVSVAPVFWALLGLGIGCNYMLKNTPEASMNGPGERTAGVINAPAAVNAKNKKRGTIKNKG